MEKIRAFSENIAQDIDNKNEKIYLELCEAFVERAAIENEQFFSEGFKIGAKLLKL